ncbi:MAG: hypothetical protein EPO58_16115 [Chitinophagaceae bacterium]|nr:MAG: hypothetical protein EPO58_16115 [Chitinophagaceae bacterium]
MKKQFFLLSLLFVCGLLFAQDPITWENSVKKTGTNRYEIHIKAIAKPSWHIFSQTSPEDGGSPTKIFFSKNPMVSFEGKTEEIGKIVRRYEKAFDVTVIFFESKVEFVQTVVLKEKVKTNLEGSIEFMACNDHQCLPTRTLKFSVRLE